MTQRHAEAGHRTPSIADLEQLAADAWASLPAEFREACGNVVIQVVDFASDETLAALGMSNPYELLGLYHGVSIDRKSVMDTGATPDMIFLYRRPLLDQWMKGEETLNALVTHVLIHEIGHHFGYSDADMEAIEDAAGP